MQLGLNNFWNFGFILFGYDRISNSDKAILSGVYESGDPICRDTDITANNYV